MADNNTSWTNSNSSKRTSPEFSKALGTVAFLFYAPLVLFSVFFAIIAIVWNYEIEYLAVINTYMKDIGIVGFLQKYVMPAWKNQEIQLIKKGFRELKVLHSASTLFTLFFTFIAFIAILFNRKMYYEDFLTVNTLKKRYAKMWAFVFIPILIIFSAFSSILFLVSSKFNFENSWEGLNPTIGGIYKNCLSVFVLIYLTFIAILLFLPVSLQISKRYAQNREP